LTVPQRAENFPTAAERRLSAQLAAHESWSRTEDRTARTAPARAAMDARFLAEAGGDPIRAENVRKAFYARLALRSATARRKARAAQLAAAADEADEILRILGGEVA
jgi:hypothetical protein